MGDVLKYKSYLVTFLCLLIFLVVIPVEIHAEAPSSGSLPGNSLSNGTNKSSFKEAVSNDVFRYHTDDGLQIISHVDTWQEDKLPEVVEELSRNAHGLEMEYLDRVEIHAGIEPGGNEQICADYSPEVHELAIPINLSGLLPTNYTLKVPIAKGVISIYKGEEKEDVADIARYLSHEYGHHFTRFHFFDGSFSSEKFKYSTYYQIRRLQQFEEVNGLTSSEREAHRWSVFEIAAEDYCQLLGSPTSKVTTRFFDISQKIGKTTFQPINMASHLDFNAIPQENWNIPLASQVDGLQSYFFSFLGNSNQDHLSSPAMSLSADQHLPILSYREEKHHGFKKHIIQWDELIVEESMQSVYTLVAVDKDNNVIPIKTVYPGEETTAVVGTVTQVIVPYIYYYQDGLDQGILDFRLYIQFPHGQVVATEVLTVSFAE